MEADILFFERQYFRQKALWLILAGVNLYVIYITFQQVFQGIKVNGDSMSNSNLLISNVILLVVTLLFAIMHLDTIIKEDGICIRFFPFQLSLKKYPFSTIRSLVVTSYDPITEFGGWGYRFTFSGKKAINISGNQGIRIEFKNGKNLLIGTNQPQAVIATLQKTDQPWYL